MALTEIYVDPSINANSGTGTIGDAYGDLQYALNTMTRDATNGDRINIKAGTAEVMAAAISLATYGTPAIGAPLVFQGYTSVAADGGIGEINNGGANVSVFDNTGIASIFFVDMKLGNCGNARILRMAGPSQLINCEIHTTTNAEAVRITSASSVIHCRFHTIDTIGLVLQAGGTLYACYFTGAYSSGACYFQGAGTAWGNIFSLTSGGRGIVLDSGGGNSTIINNSFYAAAGTGIGLRYDGATIVIPLVANNIFTGFSGAGGSAVTGGATRAILVSAKNAYYNNTTNKTSVVIHYDLGDVTLTNTPFTNAAGGDFSIATAAKAELQAQGWPSSFNGISTNQYLDPGAAQIQIPAATGGVLVHPGMSGGMRG